MKLERWRSTLRGLRAAAALVLRKKATIYRADISGAEFISSLQRSGSLYVPWKERRAGRNVFDDYVAAAHFRASLGKRGFVLPEQVAGLWKEACTVHPEWRHRLKRSTTRQLEKSYAIYSREDAPLLMRPPWCLVPPGPGGDNMYPLRPHRFAFLPRLGLALQQGVTDANAVAELVDSWISEAESGFNPFCYGSNLVAIQRLLAIFWAWTFLAARPPAWTDQGLGLEAKLLRIMRSDVRFLEERIGDSVRNNHLLADRFAGWFIHTLLPEFCETADYTVDQQFCTELHRQTYEDGGGFEHSSHYHEFACEMVSGYLLLCRANGIAPNPDICARAEAMLRFRLALTGPRAPPFPYGNAVEDTLFPLDEAGSWCSGALREIYRYLFDAETTPAPLQDSSRERAFWLLGGDMVPPTQDGGEEYPVESGYENSRTEIVEFSQSGFYVHSDTYLDSRLVFRTGPQEGTELVGGHMHADLLSVVLWMDGWPILVDAGTYTYRRPSEEEPKDVPHWRAYFAGPSAHNTLAIAHRDPLGPLRTDFRRFALEARVRSSLRRGVGLSCTRGQLLDAGHYQHYARTCLHIAQHYWLIIDEPPDFGDVKEEAWYGFQLAPGLKVTTESGRAAIESPDGAVALALLSSSKATPKVYEGSRDPLAGWVSPSYGNKVPAPQLRYPVMREAEPSAFLIAPRNSTHLEGLSVERIGSGAIGVRIETSRGRDIAIVCKEAGPVEKLGFAGVTSHGRTVWARFEKDAMVDTRTIPTPS